MNNENKNKILVLNASESILQIVVGEIDDVNKVKLLVNQEWDCPRDSTEKLAPLIKQIFSTLELPLSSVNKIASVTGAGSFTGIRLSLCSSAALSRALLAEQYSIDFLTALAYNAPTYSGCKTRVITHAKRDLVHVADFLCDQNNTPIQSEDTKLLSPEDVLNELLSENNEINYLLGSGLSKHKERFYSSIEKTKTIFLPAFHNTLNPQVLLDLSTQKTSNNKYLDAEYVRTCDAVDNLEHISKKLGNDVESSFKMFTELTK